MALKEYTVDNNGAPQTFLYDDADAERLGLTGGKSVDLDEDEVEADAEIAEPVPVKSAPAPKNKARQADSK